VCGVAVCCSVLQCVAVCCSVLQCVEGSGAFMTIFQIINTENWNMVSGVVWQCVAVCCSVLQCVEGSLYDHLANHQH